MTLIATRFVIVLPMLLLFACAASSPPQPRTTASENHPAALADPFPQPESLAAQVDFWRQVYSVWRRDQVVFHDERYMDLIYVVIELPGEVDLQSGYTPSQGAFVQEYTEALRSDLQGIVSKRRIGTALNEQEQALADHVIAVAGETALNGAAERLRSQRGLRERFKRGLEISGRYDQIFRDIFIAAGLPEDLAYLPHVESSFQLFARSSAGAAGMWQFTRPAARSYMRSHPALDERLDPVAAARGAARYLQDAYAQLDHWAFALTSYNHGIAGMLRAKQLFGNDFGATVKYYEQPRFGFASRNFYAEFLAARAIARQPERYFPEGVPFEAPLDWDRVVLSQPASAAELAAYYQIESERLVAMNLAWTRAAARSEIALPSGTEVWLPAGTLDRIVRSKQTRSENFVWLLDENDMRLAE